MIKTDAEGFVDMNKWHIFVFSFNRGRFLTNCLNSIKKCNLDIDVTVIDDNSDDPETHKILNTIEVDYGYELIKANKDKTLEKRLGGLYGNMNRALSISKERKKDYIIFIQDDMQFVRKICPADLNIVEKVFEDYEDIQQVQSCFLKNLMVDRYQSLLSPLKESKCFVLDGNKSDHGAFSAVGIFYAPRFEKNNGLFVAGERNNHKSMLEKGIKLAQLEQPFMMWLPYSTTYYSKKLNLKHKVIETVAQCGFYPIDIMDEQTHKRMIDNKEGKLPIAEHWLKADGLNDYPTWCFSAGVINLFARGGLRKKIAQLLWKV